MSSKKYKDNKANYKPQKKILAGKQQPLPSVKTKRKRRKLPVVPPFILLFVMVWIFCSLIYNNVFYIAEQYDYLAFDKTIMQNILDMNTGILILIGRFLLLSFHYSLFGGFVMAVILTLAAWLLDYGFHLKGFARLFVFVFPILYLAWEVFQGFNLYYQNEPAYIFVYPFIALFLAFIMAVVVRLKTKRHIKPFWKSTGEEKPRIKFISMLVTMVMYVGLIIFAVPFRDNTQTTVKMQRLMEDNDWDGMIDAALKVKRPSRSVCCYYAIALSQTDQIGSRMFDIHYQYPNMHIHTRTGEPDATTEYYACDGDFYAGLINTSYHECMEHSVIDGPSILRLKRMYFCSLLNGELELGYKYLNLISKMPFESDFVEKYGPMLYSPSMVKKDPNLAKVLELIPLEDSFEQWYRTPLFIGYNVMLSSGRSIRALYNSLAACLYNKDLDAFYRRTLPLRGGMLPKSFEEAVVLYGLKDADKIKNFQISPMTLQTTRFFLSDALNYKGQDRKNVYYKLCSQYLGYYPFYYYFENIPDENYFLSKKETSHVN